MRDGQLAALGLLAAAVLRLPALGIAVSVLGLPLLFAMYLRAAGTDRDVPRGWLILAAALTLAAGKKPDPSCAAA